MVMEFWTAATPNGWKVSIMLEELKEAGVDLPEVEVKALSLMDGDQFSDEFSAINPNQKIPGLVNDGVSLMESCAILLYLGETYPIDGEVDFSGFATVYELEVGVALKPLLYSIQRNYLIQKNAHALSS